MSAGIPVIVAGERAVVVGRTQCLVESKSNPGTFHTVEYSDGTWHCTCPGGTIRKTCRHITAIRDWYLGKERAVIEEPGEANRPQT